VKTPSGKAPDDLAGGDIVPSHFYRRRDASKFFGYGHSVLHLRIKAGEIPAPVALSADGRASGWFGRDILKWQAARKPKTAAARDRDNPSVAPAAKNQPRRNHDG
jgi:predicted DNA-binding transcriptional regulator AlpA